MIYIKYVNGGNAVEPQGDGFKYVIHCCNDIGAWGAGFVLAINSKWSDPEDYYRAWSTNSLKHKPVFRLGQIQEVQVEKDIAVINMIGQRGIGSSFIRIGKGVGQIIRNITPIKYEAIEECLIRVASLAKENNASVHAPKFGSGLAGGEWKHIEQLIESNISNYNISVTIYNYP